MRRWLCAVLVLASLSTVASADDGQKSEGTAIAVSIGTGVLLPIALVGAIKDAHGGGGTGALVMLTGASIIFGPTAGHWYAGRSWTNATTLRLLGTLAATYGGIIAISSDCEDSDCTSQANTAADIAVVGFGVVIGSSLYDIATAGRSAREYNSAHHIAVTPVVLPGPPGGGPAMGIGIGGTF